MCTADGSYLAVIREEHMRFLWVGVAGAVWVGLMAAWAGHSAGRALH